MLVKAKGPLQSIAASRLRDGRAVWLGHDNRWVERVEEAAIFTGPAIAAAVETAAAAVRALQVVDAYPIDVARAPDGTTVPVHIRERMKALGPSVRPDLAPAAAAQSPLTARAA